MSMSKESQASAQTADSNGLNPGNSKIAINATNCSLRDMQVKCLIAFNALMNKSHRNF